MSRLGAPILTAGEAYSANSSAPMTDLTHGGQFGWSPDLRYWLHDNKHVERNLKAVVLSFPRFVNYMPNPEKWKAAIKNLIETHPMTIEGFNAELKPEFDDTPIGGGGEVMQTLVDMKRARSEPVTTYKELYGRPIQKLLEMWMLYGMMEPETKVALVRTLSGHSAEDPGDWLADWFTMSAMFYTTDPTEWYVDKSWVCVNMAPMEMGPVIGKKDQNTAGETLALSIPWTAISAYNSGTIAFAQQYHRSLVMTNANPILRPSFISNIDPDVLSAGPNSGFKYSVEKTDLTNISTPIGA